jgi:hypothetical protein
MNLTGVIEDRARLLRAVTKYLRAVRERPPYIKGQIKEFLDQRLRELDLPSKPFKGELARFPTQGFRTQGTDCGFWWINAEHFRS